MTSMRALKFHAEPDFDPVDLAKEIAPLRAGERIRVLHERLGDHLVATTSFGLQAAVMLHLIHEHAPEIPVVFIDTGHLFPETYRYMDQLMDRFGNLDLRVYQPTVSAARMQALWGNLWEGDKEAQDRYAMLTKIEPMNRALQETGADVWLSGLRRSQSKTREDRPFVERQKKTLKAYPILDWADAQVDLYFHQHNLPRHPLQDQGYVTMGDWHSTVPATGGDAQATRFNGEKYECGLHLDSGASDFQI
jgi:phosphoadenosine phosphosulfate reductase